MNCLILGGSGLIGSHTALEMIRAGHRVRLLNREPRAWSPPLPAAEHCHADWRSLPDLGRALEGIDVVIHLISTIWPGEPGQPSFPDPEHHPDLESFSRLLALCLQKKVRRMVFLSSGGTVYGPAEQIPIPESHPARPASSYGRVKSACERCLTAFAREHGLDYLILRGANAYGEFHNPGRVQGAVNVFLRRMAQNHPLEIWGSEATIRDYVYAGDMARAIRMAALSQVSGEVFNLGSGLGTSLKDLIRTIRTVTGRSPVVVYREGRAEDVPENTLAIGRAREVLGWQPRVSLEEGILRTWKWIQNSHTV